MVPDGSVVIRHRFPASISPHLVHALHLDVVTLVRRLHLLALCRPPQLMGSPRLVLAHVWEQLC